MNKKTKSFIAQKELADKLKIPLHVVCGWVAKGRIETQVVEKYGRKMTLVDENNCPEPDSRFMSAENRANFLKKK